MKRPLRRRSPESSNQTLPFRQAQGSELRREGSQFSCIRVLQKCGFKIIGKNKDFANGKGEETEECILRLDLDQA